MLSLGIRNSVMTHSYNKGIHLQLDPKKTRKKRQKRDVLSNNSYFFNFSNDRYVV